MSPILLNIFAVQAEDKRTTKILLVEVFAVFQT